MPASQKYLSAYFTFTRKERTGIVTVILLILVLVLLPFLFPYFIQEKKYDHSRFEKEIAALKIKQPDSGAMRFSQSDESSYRNSYPTSEKNFYRKEAKGELFYFDPNTLPADGWRKLGIREKTMNTIKNYIAKGGRFYKPEDIGKIWGLHEDEVKRLLPFVRIEQVSKENYISPKGIEIRRPSEKPGYAKTMVDINLADSSALIGLPGIGSKLANRIIAFRERLGGFYSVNQVAETYALPDSTFQKIKDRLVAGHSDIKQLNINTATTEELKMHPYIRYNIANAMVQYRNQHGNFASISDLKNILIITPDVFKKMEPYLTVR
jgi:competence protein ComEA